MSRPCPTLLSLTDGSNILVDQPILLFGRDQECDVQLNSKKISRRHCCLIYMDDRLMIRDLKSMNGVRVNGQRVTTTAEVKMGDCISIGNYRYRVYIGETGEFAEDDRQNEASSMTKA